MTASYNRLYREKLAVLYEGQGDFLVFQQLADRLGVPLENAVTGGCPGSLPFYLTWRDGCLNLIDTAGVAGRSRPKKGGLTVDIEPRPGEQRSWPAPKTGALAHALGRKTKTVIDATTGWGQDSLCIFRMGYRLVCIERSPVMFELLTDAFKRLAEVEWVRHLGITPPALLAGNAIEILAELETPPDCIYIDPMFPSKRKKSALAKKSMTVLRDLLGDDQDRAVLFAAAFDAAGRRVVVKSPDYAEPLGGRPSASFQGKLLRYDVYLKG